MLCCQSAIRYDKEVKPKGRLKKGCLLTAIVCVVLYLGLLGTLRMMQPPVAPITWQVDLPGDGYFQTIHVCPNGNLAVVTTDNVVFINPEGEVVREHHPSGTNFGDGDMDNLGNLYVGGDDGYVFAFSTVGEKKWEVKLPDRQTTSPKISRSTKCRVDEIGNVVVQLHAGELAVLSPQGEVLQHVAFPFTLSGWDGPLRISEDQFAVVKFGSTTRHAVAVVDLAGNEVWATDLSGISIRSIDRQGDAIIAYTAGNGIHALALDGTLLWSFQNLGSHVNHTYCRFAGVEVSGTEIYYSSGESLFSLDRDGKIDWQLPSDGVALPIFSNGNRILFSKYTIPTTESRIINWLYQNSLYGPSYPQQDRHVELIEAVDQKITRRWQLPNNVILGSEFGMDGEVYGYTRSDSKKNIPLTIYRIDLEP